MSTLSGISRDNFCFFDRLPGRMSTILRFLASCFFKFFFILLRTFSSGCVTACNTTTQYSIPTSKPSQEVTPTTLITLLADHGYGLAYPLGITGCYLFIVYKFTVYNSSLLFSHSQPCQQLLSSFSSCDCEL